MVGIKSVALCLNSKSIEVWLSITGLTFPCTGEVDVLEMIILNLVMLCLAVEVLLDLGEINLG